MSDYWFTVSLVKMGLRAFRHARQEKQQEQQNQRIRIINRINELENLKKEIDEETERVRKESKRLDHAQVTMFNNAKRISAIDEEIERLKQYL